MRLNEIPNWRYPLINSRYGSNTLSFELLKELARTFKAKFPVGVFERIEEAEKWLLTLY
jgi:hypothetical protein